MKQHNALMRLKLPLLIAGLLSLSACGTPSPVFNAAPVKTTIFLPAKPTTNPCILLPLQVYTDKQNAELANEVMAAGATTIWPDMLIDYARLRDSVKACRGK